MSRPSVVLSGALVRIYINNKIYSESQSVEYSIDYGEAEIYGIDSPFPQEITSTRVSVSGSVQGVRIRNSGGLQSYGARSSIADVMKSQYVSIRIQDRSTGEDLLFIPDAKITRQALSMAAKGVARLSFSFKGLVPFESIDRQTT